MMILGIYGTGGAGREVVEIATTCAQGASPAFAVVFIDDFKNGETLYDAEVLSFDTFTAMHPAPKARIVIGVGEPALRRALWVKSLNAGYQMQTLIHPEAVVSTRAVIGQGSIIRHGVFVSCDCVIGNNVDIQVNSYIGHDSAIGDHSEICALVTIGGNCSLAEEVFVGQGSAIREHTTIGRRSIIGMGSSVVSSFPEESVLLGNPAKLIRKNDIGKVFNTDL